MSLAKTRRISCLALMTLLTLPGCTTIREGMATVVVAPVALFAWGLNTIDPRPDGPCCANTPTQGADVFNAQSQRVGYVTIHHAGTPSLFGADGVRIGSAFTK